MRHSFMRSPIVALTLLLSASVAIADSTFVEFRVPCQRTMEQVSKGAARYYAKLDFLVTFAAPDIGVVYAERRERDAQGEVVTIVRVATELDTIHIRCRSMRGTETVKLSPVAIRFCEELADWAGSPLIPPSDSPDKP